MALKFQYNKTALQRLNKQLNIRLRALPTLKNKEAALRVEVKKARDKAQGLEQKLEQQMKAQPGGIWNEFKSEIISLGEVKTVSTKIAGVKIPVVKEIGFEERKFSLFTQPDWFPEGISIVKKLAETALEKKFYDRKAALLDHARRKTTQKVNLYEKVQIPEFEDAIRKIKRFLEDEENLSKSAQKIVKKRRERQEETL